MKIKQAKLLHCFTVPANDKIFLKRYIKFN